RSPVNATTPQMNGAASDRRMWREIRRILAQVAVTFRSTLQANRPIPGFVARFAVGLALALSLCAHAVSAQDTVHVVPPDSAGYISRAQAALFQRALILGTPSRPPAAAWDRFPGTGRTAGVVVGFDRGMARQPVQNHVDAMRQ